MGENKSDLDPVFSKLFDEDYDEKVAGVTRTAFVRIYAEWIRYCIQRCKDNEVSWPYFHPIHILTYLWRHSFCAISLETFTLPFLNRAQSKTRGRERGSMSAAPRARGWVQKEAVGTAPSHVSITQIGMA